MKLRGHRRSAPGAYLTLFLARHMASEASQLVLFKMLTEDRSGAEDGKAVEGTWSVVHTRANGLAPLLSVRET